MVSKAELFEVMGLGPVWELKTEFKTTQGESEAPQSSPTSVPLEDTEHIDCELLVIAPEMLTSEQMPDLSKPAAVLLVNMLKSVGWNIEQDVQSRQLMFRASESALQWGKGVKVVSFAEASNHAESHCIRLVHPQTLLTSPHMKFEAWVKLLEVSKAG